MVVVIPVVGIVAVLGVLFLFLAAWLMLKD